MILVAEYLDDRQRRVVAEIAERPVRIGRSPTTKTHDSETRVIETLEIPWNDRLINRSHSVARRDGDDLIVERLPAKEGRHEPNRIYSHAPIARREVLEDPLRIKPGEAFVIGRLGRTAFHWVDSIEALDTDPAASALLPTGDAQDDAAFLAENGSDDFVPLDEYTLRLQLRLLQRELPEQVLSGWTDERDLFIRAAAFMHGALPNQKGVAAAFVAVDLERGDGEFELLSPDPNTRTDFQPSRRLLAKLELRARNGGDPQIWTPTTHPKEFAEAESLQRPIEWIAAVPVCSLDENATIYHTPDHRPVYLYVEAAQATRADGKDGRPYLPFMRLVASLVASLLSAREKQRIQDQMSAFFSPGLREKMRGGDQQALEPAMTDCTVIFVDRRGSSKIMETAKSDEQILHQLRDNQDIVGEITQTIFDHDGVITDFSGDGVLALWGWPPDADSSEDHARLAVEAAGAIAAKLESRVEYDDRWKRDFSPIRIGISTGRIAVGKTGPAQQMHISVFGSVVNLGARLEKIAKDFQVPTLLSGETVDRLRSDGERAPQVRRLCYIKPAGFAESYPIFELILPRSLGGSGVSAADTEKYERALDAFVERRWNDARDLLAELPADDRPSKWLTKKVQKFRKKSLDHEWQGEIESLLK